MTNLPAAAAKTHIDAGTDSVPQARGELETHIDKFNQTLQFLDERVPQLVEVLSFHGSLSAAVTAIGGNTRTLVIDQSDTVTANLTVPANIALLFLRGNVLSINTAVALTIDGALQAGIFQIFSLTGTAAVDGTADADVIRPEWFGAVHDGVADDEPAINAANRLAGTARCREVRCLDAEYAIGDLVTVGNGSETLLSTENSVLLQGTGHPQQRLRAGPSVLKNYGTRFKWIGAAGGTMVRIEGPCQGNALRNIALNGNNGLADRGLEVISAQNAAFYDLTISDCATISLRLNARTAESIEGAGVGQISTGRLQFHHTNINTADAGTAPIAIECDGTPGVTADGTATTICLFEHTFLQVSRAGSTGLRLAHCDQITFRDIIYSVSGVSNDNEKSVHIVGIETTTSSIHFPQNIRFEGNNQITTDGAMPVVVDNPELVGYGIELGGFANLAGTNLDSFPAELGDGVTPVGLTGEVTSPGQFPKGGYRQSIGLAQLRESFKNLLRNARWLRATNGTSFAASPANDSELLDGVKVLYDGTSENFTVDRAAHTVGQSAIPYEPKYALAVNQTGAIGGTFFKLAWEIPDVETLEGRQAILSAWVFADGVYSLTATVHQNFGTGGSPSSVVNTTSAAVNTINGGSHRLAFPITIPAISGKTLGSNDDDFIRIDINLPLGAGFLIRLTQPQFEPGIHPTHFDWRPEWLDDLAFQILTDKIADAQITYAKLQNVSAAERLLGRGAGAGAGVAQEITLGANLTLSGTVLSAAAGSGIDELTSDVTAGPGSGSQAATIAANAVTNAKLADMAANTAKVRAAGTSGDPSDLAVAANTVLGRKGGNIVAETIITAQIANDQITYAKLQNVSAASRVLGRGEGAGAGDPQEITLAANLAMTGTELDLAASIKAGISLTKAATTPELTISGGAITVSGQSFIHVDTEADAAADDLDTINGGTHSQILVLRTASGARDVTLKDGTGNLSLAGDFVLDTPHDRMTLMYDSALSAWVELASRNNA